MRIQHQFYDKFLIFCYILLFKTKCASVLERSIIDSSARNFPCTEKMFLPLFNSLCEIYFHQVNISYKFPIYFKLSGRSKTWFDFSKFCRILLHSFFFFSLFVSRFFSFFIIYWLRWYNFSKLEVPLVRSIFIGILNFLFYFDP